MTSPTDEAGVRRFCGMVQYMARFLPGLSNTLEPIRKLTRKDSCENCFQEVKHNLTSAPVLAYFEPKKELPLQVDSSKDGFGAVLMQQGRPIEYASRALTSSERKWAQIEKEALAVLFGVQGFDLYTYGRQVTVENDHKPLESILRKPLSNAPKRLQDIMMKLNRFDKKELVIKDTLSRAYINEETETRLDIFMVQVNSDLNDSRLQEIREATAKDPDI